MIEKLKQLGVKRVVLARECTKDEIEACVKTGMEIEVFIHGALCICYSGQCLLSSVFYDRSGNRGMCAQPCRMKYRLYENGKQIQLNDEYLLSPKDLSLLDKIDDLEKLGVCSLKIEGRMKNAAYVYESVRQVKMALDHIDRSIVDREHLMVTFNRGPTLGHMYDKRGKELMNMKTCNHQGIELGKVIKVKGKHIWIKLDKALRQNDGIRFKMKHRDDGCIVNYMYDNKHRLINSMVENNIVEIIGPDRINVGASVLKTLDSDLNQMISDQIKHSKRQIALHARITCMKVGDPLTIDVYDDKYHIRYQSDILSIKAKNRASNDEVFNKQFSKTNDAWAYFDKIEYQLGNDIYFPISVINQARRDSLEMMKITYLDKAPVKEIDYECSLDETKTENDIYEIERYDQLIDYDGIFISEMIRHDKVLSKGNISTIEGDICAHLGKGKIVEGLNVTNSYAIAAILELGYSSVVLSDELDIEQIKLMMDAFKSRYGFDAPVYKTIYQRKRLMIMKHCPINTILKDGKRINCGLCHVKHYELEGMDKKRMYCLGDSDCHMRLFDAKINDETNMIKVYKQLGIDHFRYVFTDESKAEIEALIN